MTDVAATGAGPSDWFMSTDWPEWADPHPTYHRMRAAAPLAPLSDGGWALTRHADCEGVLRDPRWSSNTAHLTGAAAERVANHPARSVDLPVLLFMDPPDHTRLRRLVSKAFTPRSVERMRAHITELVDAELDRAADVGELDVVNELGYRLPATVICELMGVPVADQDQFHGWSADATRLLDGELDEETTTKGIVAVLQFIDYFNGLFEERRRAPADDLVSRLLATEEEGDRLSEEELRAIVLLLFMAGHETTMNLIGNGTYALLRHPDELARLRDDPSLDATAVEELLRFDGPVHITARIATVDLEVGGQPMPAGSEVACLLAAANRDPARFPDPDRLDVGRADCPHLTFSYGIHYCLGAALARAEGQIAIPRLIRRFPHLELATAEPTYRPHLVLRGLTELRVAVR
jgi:cytochrome P450